MNLRVRRSCSTAFASLGRTHKQFADHADALRGQRMVVLQPTEVDERVTDLLFHLRRHR